MAFPYSGRGTISAASAWRAEETPREAAQRDETIDRAHHGSRSSREQDRQHEQPHRAAEQECQRSQHDPPAVVAIRDVTGVKRRANERKCLGQADEAQGEFIVGEFVNLPPHHRSLDLNRDRVGEQTHDIQPEIREAEGGVRVCSGLRHPES
jgi:hypothetical protein